MTEDGQRAARASNLPRVVKRIFGRDDALAQIEAALAGGSDVVSVFGPPGTGKTLLVQHFAAAHLAAFLGRALWCDLTDATSVDDICRVVGRALDLELPGGCLVSFVARALAARGNALVLLDNVEHVPDATAGEALATWTERAPEFRLASIRDASSIDAVPIVLEASRLRPTHEGRTESIRSRPSELQRCSSRSPS
jgi:hypothetical protein